MILTKVITLKLDVVQSAYRFISCPFQRRNESPLPTTQSATDSFIKIEDLYKRRKTIDFNKVVNFNFEELQKDENSDGILIAKLGSISSLKRGDSCQLCQFLLQACYHLHIKDK